MGQGSPVTATPRASWQLRPWRLPVVGAFALLGLIHVTLTALGDPFGREVDFLLWIASTALKLATGFALFSLLVETHRRISGSARAAKVAFVVWGGAAAATLSGLALTRARWAPEVSNDAVKYFHTHGAQALDEEVLETFRSAWSSGAVLASEVILFLVLAAVQVFVAHRFGGRPNRSAIAACFLCNALLAAYLFWCPWSVSTHDFFHGDIVAGAVLIDQLVIVANDPYTTVALPMYVAFALGHLVIAEFAG